MAILSSGQAAARGCLRVGSAKPQRDARWLEPGNNSILRTHASSSNNAPVQTTDFRLKFTCFASVNDSFFGEGNAKLDTEILL
jgi:hypothetical protein